MIGNLKDKKNQTNKQTKNKKTKNKQKQNKQTKKTQANKHFVVYVFDTPLTLKQDQGRQTRNDNLDPKEGYTHANFKKILLQ